MKHSVGEPIRMLCRCRENGKWITRHVAGVIAGIRDLSEQPYLIRIIERAYPHEPGNTCYASRHSIEKA